MKPLVHYKKRSCQQRTYAQLTPVLNTPHAQRTSTKIDEIKEYRTGGVSPPEAMWRMFAFPISEIN